MHPRQPPLAPDVEAVWLAGLTDAEVDPGEALLYTFPGISSEGEDFHAVTWPRDWKIDSGGGSDLDGVLAELNDEACIGAVRVAVWTERTIEGVAALLRHELEHARQYAAHPGLHGLYVVAQEILRGVPGGSVLYNAMPVEWEANRAAATFARAFYGSERIEELVAKNPPDVAALRSPGAPASLDALPERMVQFLAAHSALCQRYAITITGKDEGATASFRRFLNLEWTGAGDLWERLVTEPELQLSRE